VVAAAKGAVVRGFDSLPVHPRASSSVGTSACLTNRRSLVRFQPCPLTPCGCSSAVERPLETRGAAGSIPAGHVTWLRSSTRQSTRLLIGRLQVRRLPAPLEGLPRARYPVSKTGGPARALGVRLPLLPSGGMAEWESSALLRRRALWRFAGSNPAASVFGLRPKRDASRRQPWGEPTSVVSGHDARRPER
jgi:hypothetical protein